MTWAPNTTPCTPAWWLDYSSCFGGSKCPPCSWSVPADMPQAVGIVNPYYPFAPYAPPYPQYGFEGCCGPPPPPYPVPYQMAQSWPAPANLYRRPCPSIYVGGACCTECASGAACSGAAACCDACAAGSACSCGAASPSPITASSLPIAVGAHVRMRSGLQGMNGAWLHGVVETWAGSPDGLVRWTELPSVGTALPNPNVEIDPDYYAAASTPYVGAFYVSDAELDMLGSQVALMGTDVDAAVAAQEASLPAFEGNLAHAVWQLCKDQKASWDYKTQECDFTKPDPTGASIGDAPGTPPHPLAKFRLERWTPFQMKWNAYRAQTIHEPTGYDVLRTEMSTMLDEWKALGQTTRAVVPPPLADSSGSNAIPWGWIALGVGVAVLPFLLPVLAGTYLAITKGRGLGLAA